MLPTALGQAVQIVTDQRFLGARVPTGKTPKLNSDVHILQILEMVNKPIFFYNKTNYIELSNE